MSSCTFLMTRQSAGQLHRETRSPQTCYAICPDMHPGTTHENPSTAGPREQAHDQPSHWRDASTDRHDKSCRDDGSRDKHDRVQDRHSRLSDKHGSSSHRQHRSDDRHDSKSGSRHQDACSDRHTGTKYLHSQHVSSRSRNMSPERQLGNRKDLLEQEQHASCQDRSRMDQHKRKQSTSPHSDKYIANNRFMGV